MWSSVWPGVCVTNHSRFASRSTSPDFTGFEICGTKERPTAWKSRHLRRISHGGRGRRPPHGVVCRLQLCTTWRCASSFSPAAARSSAETSLSSSLLSSTPKRNERCATISAFASRAKRIAPPKWSGCECVTITVCTWRGVSPACLSRSLTARHESGPGSPGSTTAAPRSSIRAYMFTWPRPGMRIGSCMRSTFGATSAISRFALSCSWRCGFDMTRTVCQTAARRFGPVAPCAVGRTALRSLMKARDVAARARQHPGP
jgi:hypothetical protein